MWNPGNQTYAQPVLSDSWPMCSQVSTTYYQSGPVQFPMNGEFATRYQSQISKPPPLEAYSSSNDRFLYENPSQPSHNCIQHHPVDETDPHYGYVDQYTDSYPQVLPHADNLLDMTVCSQHHHHSHHCVPGSYEFTTPTTSSECLPLQPRLLHHDKQPQPLIKTELPLDIIGGMCSSDICPELYDLQHPDDWTEQDYPPEFNSRVTPPELTRQHSVDSTDDWLDRNLPSNPQEPLSMGLAAICAELSTPQGSCGGDSFVEIKHEISSPRPADETMRDVLDLCDTSVGIPGRCATSSLEGTRTRRLSLSSKSAASYFWQYNAQCKGPKAELVSDLMDDSSEEDVDLLDEACSPSPTSSLMDQQSGPAATGKWPQSPLRRRVSSDPYVLTVFKDPVQRRQELIHCAKLRRGDGNDVTPNPVRLSHLGQELSRLNSEMLRQSGLAQAALGACAGGDPNTGDRGDTLAIVDRAKKEKNKLASKICRLKKKAFHEANKIKYMGLRLEHEELLQTISLVKRSVFLRLHQSPTSTSTTSPVSDLDDNNHCPATSSLGRQTSPPTALLSYAEQTLHQHHKTLVAQRLDLFVHQVMSLIQSNPSSDRHKPPQQQQHPLLASLVRPEGTMTALPPSSNSSSTVQLSRHSSLVDMKGPPPLT